MLKKLILVCFILFMSFSLIKNESKAAGQYLAAVGCGPGALVCVIGISAVAGAVIVSTPEGRQQVIAIGYAIGDGFNNLTLGVANFFNIQQDYVGISQIIIDVMPEGGRSIEDINEELNDPELKGLIEEKKGQSQSGQSLNGINEEISRRTAERLKELGVLDEENVFIPSTTDHNEDTVINLEEIFEGVEVVVDRLLEEAVDIIQDVELQAIVDEQVRVLEEFNYNKGF